jgi:peptide deformylase
VAVREILQLGNPILWRESEHVSDCNSDHVRNIIQDLDDTLKAFREREGYGRALAGPQISHLKRIVFVRMPPSGLCGALINPEIVWESRERITLWDDCLSFPELLVQVSRARSVRVKYLDADGKDVTVEAEGALSELLQHEIDHLDGILAIERAVSPQSFMTRYEWERSGRARP